MKKLMQLLIPAAALLVAIPNHAQAQCTERCVIATNGNGQDVGWGCASGTAGHDCAATINECRLTTTNCGGGEELFLADASGASIGTAKVCKTQQKTLELIVARKADLKPLAVDRAMAIEAPAASALPEQRK